MVLATDSKAPIAMIVMNKVTLIIFSPIIILLLARLVMSLQTLKGIAPELLISMLSTIKSVSLCKHG